jgi:hypothetical protein
MIIVPIQKMTDLEIEAEAIRRERNGEHGHARELRVYLGLRHKFGVDHSSWPQSAVAAEIAKAKQGAVVKLSDEAGHTREAATALRGRDER